jgi:hypothetical protein
MLSEDCVTVLDRLLEATPEGRLEWRSDPDAGIVASIEGERREVVIRRLRMEIVGRPGAHPYQFELEMPGWNVRFPISGDSDGSRRVCAILEAAGFPIARGGSAQQEVEFLDIYLPRSPQKTI